MEETAVFAAVFAILSAGWNNTYLAVPQVVESSKRREDDELITSKYHAASPSVAPLQIIIVTFPPFEDLLRSRNSNHHR